MNRKIFAEIWSLCHFLNLTIIKFQSLHTFSHMFHISQHKRQVAETYAQNILFSPGYKNRSRIQRKEFLISNSTQFKLFTTQISNTNASQLIPIEFQIFYTPNLAYNSDCISLLLIKSSILEIFITRFTKNQDRKKLNNYGRTNSAAHW